VAWKYAYAAKIPDARVAVVKDSRHIAPVDQPAQVNQMIRQFLTDR
jgi:hypothetical protein